MNKKIEEKEILNKNFSFFLGIINVDGENFFLFAEYVIFVGKISSHKFYNIFNVEAISCKDCNDKNVLS